MSKRQNILLAVVCALIVGAFTLIVYCEYNPNSLYNKQLFYGDYDRKFGGHRGR